MGRIIRPNIILSQIKIVSQKKRAINHIWYQ
jgi:hypothetical protein